MADLTNIENRIQDISNNLTQQQNRLNLHLVDCENDISDINIKIAALEREDLELHDEIHDVAVKVDENTARIDLIIAKNYQGQIDILENTLIKGDNSLQDQLNEMDVEHHEELHRLAGNLDYHSNQINNIAIEQAKIPEHVVLSESEYDALDNPSPEKLYFVYEDE